MAFHIAFEKATKGDPLKSLVKALAGPYVHTEMIVSHNSTHTAYSAYVNDVFSRTFRHDFPFNDADYDFLILPGVDAEALYRISTACEACAQSKTKYNFKDMALAMVPFRHPTERDLYHAGTLFCSQAVVLTLRASLPPEHVVVRALQDVNSRTVTPSQLHKALQPYCRSVLFDDVLRSVR